MIPITVVKLGEEEEALVLQVLRSGMLAQGTMVQRFEELCRAMTGAQHAVAVNNGTTALVVALEALQLQAGDEVVTSPFTFVATLNAILEAGASVRFADITEIDFNLDPASLPAVLSERTKVLMPVHLYGQPADMAPIAATAAQRGLSIVEDAAQAHGAHYGGRPIGTYGQATFSFYATKNLSAGEGGVVTTDDDALADRLRLLRNQGMRARYYYELAGHNYRLTDLAAAVAIPQFNRLPAIVAARGQRRVLPRAPRWLARGRHPDDARRSHARAAPVHAAHHRRLPVRPRHRPGPPARARRRRWRLLPARGLRLRVLPRQPARAHRRGQPDRRARRPRGHQPAGAPAPHGRRARSGGRGRHRRRGRPRVTGRIMIVFGTRPEMIKLAPVIHRLGERALVVHTGQHFDDNMSRAFLEQLHIGQPHLHLEVGGTTRGAQIGNATVAIEQFLLDEHPAAVVVQGDTNSGLAGALAANSTTTPSPTWKPACAATTGRCPRSTTGC